MKETKFIVVDESDQIIGHKRKEDIRQQDIYRVSALWITNSTGEILLSKRHRSKSHDPSKWICAVTGTVEEGESYEENIIKEAEEELGLKNITLALGPKTKIDGYHNHFTQWYKLLVDKEIEEFRLQEGEVEEIAWISENDLAKELGSIPEKFGPNLKKYFTLFQSR